MEVYKRYLDYCSEVWEKDGKTPMTFSEWLDKKMYEK